MEETHRVFIAVRFPDAVVKEVARLQALLSKETFAGKLTELENLHVTLKFLGEIDAEKLQQVRAVLGNVRVQAFDARLLHVGSFSYRGMPRIVWVKVGGGGIFELQKQIDEAMARCGFTQEERFMSHLTIVRVKYVKDVTKFRERLKAMRVLPLTFSVESFDLLESELQQMGPVYREVERYALRG